jgi:hypothetical protein
MDVVMYIDVVVIWNGEGSIEVAKTQAYPVAVSKLCRCLANNCILAG